MAGEDVEAIANMIEECGGKTQTALLCLSAVVECVKAPVTVTLEHRPPKGAMIKSPVRSQVVTIIKFASLVTCYMFLREVR